MILKKMNKEHAGTIVKFQTGNMIVKVQPFPVLSLSGNWCVDYTIAYLSQHTEKERKLI